MRSSSAQTGARLGLEAEADVHPHRLGVRNVGCAPQQVDRFDSFVHQCQPAFFSAVEVEHVVDQAHQAVAVADRHFDHLPLLFRTLIQ